MEGRKEITVEPENIEIAELEYEHGLESSQSPPNNSQNKRDVSNSHNHIRENVDHLGSGQSEWRIIIRLLIPVGREWNDNDLAETGEISVVTAGTGLEQDA